MTRPINFEHPNAVDVLEQSSTRVVSLCILETQMIPISSLDHGHVIPCPGLLGLTGLIFTV